LTRGKNSSDVRQLLFERPWCSPEWDECLLYVAAMSAKKNNAWKPLFEHYRAKGLSSTAALVILARRIARTAWSMDTYKTEFDPARLTKSLTCTIGSFGEYEQPPLPAKSSRSRCRAMLGSDRQQLLVHRWARFRVLGWFTIRDLFDGLPRKLLDF